MSEIKYIYKAFISYSQDPDKVTAKMLEDRIERFGIGWHRLKKQKLFIFRDVTDLVPDKNLPEKIEEALSSTEFLIVLAQKKFSANDFSWVNVEAEYFVNSCVERGDDPADYIILAVTDGDIEWDRIKNQWNFEITNVIPQSLRQIFKHEPLYVDLRPLNDESASKSQKNKIFRDALIAIVAKLLYKKPSEIQNQIIKLQRYVIGFIALVLVFISFLSVYAKIQKDTAVLNAEEARKQEQIAKDNEDEAKKQAQIAKDNEEEAKRQENIAVTNAEEAKRQEHIAVENAEEAKRQENIAVENAEEAKRQEQIAKDNELEAKRQEELAKTERAKTDTINKLIEAENLALKALDFYNSLDDTLVSNSSAEVDFEAESQRDSINKAFSLFYDYGGIKKEEHKNKLETLYTSSAMSYIFFSESKTRLDSFFDMVYQTPDNKTIVSNLQGQIYDIDSRQNVVDYIDNFVEITPVWGSSLILFSNYEKNINLFDIESKKLYQIESKDLIGKDVVVNATGEDKNTISFNSKNGTTFQLQFSDNKQSLFPTRVAENEPQEVSFKEGRNFFIDFAHGNLKVTSKAGIKILEDVSCYCTDQDRNHIFWGSSNGDIHDYNIAQNNVDYSIASLKDRINKIHFDTDNQMLILQVGANQLVMFTRLEWGFTKIYQEIIGNRINDICLGENGRIYVLYDRNRLVYWPVQNDLFKQHVRKLANQ